MGPDVIGKGMDVKLKKKKKEQNLSNTALNNCSKQRGVKWSFDRNYQYHTDAEIQITGF